MRKFRFYYNGIREVYAFNESSAKLRICETFKSLGKLTPSQLTKEISFLEVN